MQNITENDMTLMQYIGQQTDVNIPLNFIQQFVHSYNNRNQWIASNVLYDQYFKVCYSRYDNFIRELKRHLSECDIKEQDPSPSVKQKHKCVKKIYLISQQGIKIFSMVSDKKTREYFVRLEAICFSFLDYQRDQQQKQIQQSQAQIQQLQQQIQSLDNRPASTYQFIVNNEIIYVGVDKSENQGRIQDHFKNSRKIQANHQQIDIALALHNEQDITVVSNRCLYKDANAIETQLIAQIKPKYNQRGNPNNKFECQRCKKVYVSRAYFTKHNDRCNVQQQASEQQAQQSQ